MKAPDERQAQGKLLEPSRQASGEIWCIGFVLAPRFSLLALGAAVDALRAANMVSERSLYAWVALSEGGGEVQASSGLHMSTLALEDAGRLNGVAVCGGERTHDWAPPKLLHWLRARSREGLLLGALSDGSFVVAEAGLFDNIPSTIHWQCLDAYRERYAAVKPRASLFELSEKRFSCAGGTAALDLFLTIIQRQHGMALSVAVADNFLHDRIRESESVQRLSSFYHVMRRSPPVALAVRAMEQHIEAPRSITAIAAAVEISPRQLDRLFHRHLGTAPSRHYLAIRLAHARRLLAQTSMQIPAVAAATGFSSAAHLASAFRDAYGTSPGRYRRGGC